MLSIEIDYYRKMQKALITTSNGKRLVLPQEKLKIPYNILFILKTSIFTLYKDNISTFI